MDGHARRARPRRPPCSRTDCEARRSAERAAPGAHLSWHTPHLLIQLRGPRQACAVPRKNLLCCGMLRHAAACRSMLRPAHVRTYASVGNSAHMQETTCTTLLGRINHFHRPVWLDLWILPALKTRAQYKSNNHLTGGSARPRPVTPCHDRPHATGGSAAKGNL